MLVMIEELVLEWRERGQTFKRTLSISFMLMEQGPAIKCLRSGGQESWNCGEPLRCTVP